MNLREDPAFKRRVIKQGKKLHAYWRTQENIIIKYHMFRNFESYDTVACEVKSKQNREKII